MSDADETLDGLTPDFKLRMLRRAMDTGVVSPAMFGSAGNRALRPPSQRVAEEIEAWWAKYRKPVPPDILRGLVGEAAARLSPEERAAVMGQLDAVLAAPLDALEFINERCLLTRAELARLGTMRAAEILGGPVITAEGLQQVQEIYRSLGAPLGPGDIKVLSAQDILDYSARPVDWLVDGLLPATGTSNLVAKPKVGKSALARQLAMSVGAGGEDWLGRRVVRRGVVLYLSLEGLSATAYHFNRSALTIGPFCRRT